MPKTKHPLLVYVEYPVRAPKQYVSPGTLLKWQAGDSFDFSLMTCSFLLGAGYDAYCVYGYAPKFVCTRDQSKLECPAVNAKAAVKITANASRCAAQEVSSTGTPDIASTPCTSKAAPRNVVWSLAARVEHS